MQSTQNSDPVGNIGTFLVVHKGDPKVEHVDNIQWDDLDVRQETIYRCLRVFQRHEVEVTDLNLIDVLCEHRASVLRNLENTRVDAYRRLRGRGAQRGKDKRTIRANFSADCEMDSWVWAGEYEVAGNEGMIDPMGNHAHEQIECDFEGELRRIYECGTAAEQKAMRILAEWQRRKECGENCYGLRKAIHKLKKRLQAEGSQFDLNPRYL